MRPLRTSRKPALMPVMTRIPARRSLTVTEQLEVIGVPLPAGSGGLACLRG